MLLTDYSLSDFLMFSPASYYRQFELLNDELWPGHLLFVALALSLLWSMFRPGPRSTSWIALLMATVWALVALLYLHRYYAQINLLADWFAVAFLLQALFFLACHFSQSLQHRFFNISKTRLQHPGLLLTLYAIFIHPLVTLLQGHSWQGIEIFGLSPDVTALATIGLLLNGSLRRNWLLLLLPFTWCLFSALTYLAMQQNLGMLPLLFAAMAFLATIIGSKQTNSDGAST